MYFLIILLLLRQQLESSASASASASSNAEALQKEINKLRTQLEMYETVNFYIFFFVWFISFYFSVGTRGEQKNKLAARQADEIESLQHELQQQKDSSKTAVQSVREGKRKRRRRKGEKKQKRKRTDK